MHDLKILEEQSMLKIKACNNILELEALRVEYFGKNGSITLSMKSLASMSIDEKKKFGLIINETKEKISTLIEQKKAQFQEQILIDKLNSEKIDTSLPFRKTKEGTIHPITQATEELVEIMGHMGFKLVQGPEIEDDYHNFTALNIPENHPARLMHDTFYLQNNALLRTHTSCVQIRAMKNLTPPIRIISYGRVYRCDSDMTHTPMFHQLEGLLIDQAINMSHLKGCIIELLRKFFEMSDLEVRFRPSFFPFTEPSAEVDIGYHHANENSNNNINWLEVLGCGMIHPNVLKNLNIDPEIYQGFAFGMGIDRMSMLKYGIKDLRQCFEGDIRWHNHYGFSAFDIPTLTRGLSK